MDDDAGDASRVLQPHLRPRLAGVGGTEDAPAERDMTADEWLTGAHPHDVRVRRSDGERSDRRNRLIVEDGVPVETSVGGLPESARRRTGVIRVAVPVHARDRGDAIAFRPDMPPLHSSKSGGVNSR